MAKTNGKDKRAAWEVDFVSVELSKEQKALLKTWDESGEKTSDAITRLVADGFKLSVWGDKSHDCCGATLTSPKSDGNTRQKCLSARGPDFFGALKSVAFKHLIVLEGDWATLDNRSDPDDQWG